MTTKKITTHPQLPSNEKIDSPSSAVDPVNNNQATTVIQPFNHISNLVQPLRHFIESTDYPPSENELSVIKKLFSFCCDYFPEVNFDIRFVEMIYFIRFPHELIVKHSELSDDFISLTNLSWNSLKTFVKIIQQSPDEIKIRRDFVLLTEKLLQYSTHFSTWKSKTIGPLCHLFIRLEIEKRVNQNSPDTVYDYIDKTITALQDDICSLVEFIDPPNYQNLIAKAMSDLNIAGRLYL